MHDDESWTAAREKGLILAISGSLRSQSSNTALLRAASLVAPQDVQVVVYGGLADLPHFNPDDQDVGNSAVAALRAAVEQAHGLMIASPEYAHGIPGSLKNALDWLVSTGELYGKAVATLNASPRAMHADAALREVLVTMGANLVTTESTMVPVSAAAEPSAIVADPNCGLQLREVIELLKRALAKAECARDDAFGHSTAAPQPTLGGL